MTTPPTLEEFLTAPIEQVQKVAPQTVIYQPGGTRRGAALAGMPMSSYADWTTERMLHVTDILFQHGIRHVFTTLLGPKNFQEVTPEYREHLWEWAGFVANDQSMDMYRKRGWRVRILYEQYLPELSKTVERLRETLSAPDQHTLWYMFTPERFLPIRWMMDTLKHSSPQNIDETIQLLYGQVVPLATLCLSHGKPILLSEFLPPLIYEVLNCFWTQKPHYLDEQELRAVIYDCVYMRKTWIKDKSERAKHVTRDREVWENAPIVGLGRRVGPFWYPATIPEPPLSDDET